MTTRTIEVQIQRGDGMCFVPVPFDPKAVFGKVRAPVRITLNGYSYRSTIASMAGMTCIPLRRSNREAAGLNGDETVSVTIELDTRPREIEVPDDLRSALVAKRSALTAWEALSYSHRREHVESVMGAKKPTTRTRRIQAIVAAVTAK